MADEHGDLERAFRKLRRVQAPLRLTARLRAALEQVDQHRAHEKERFRARLVRHTLLALPGIASVVVACHMLVVDGFDVSRVAEQVVDLDGRGAAAVHIGLSFDPHESAPASVHLEVPHGLEMAGRGDDGRGIDAPHSCNLRGCIYEFTHHPTGTSRPIEVRVKAPGRYRLEAQHVSDLKRVHEVFLIHAR